MLRCPGMGGGAKSRAANALPDAELYYENTLKYLRAQYRYFQPDHVVFACDHEEEYPLDFIMFLLAYLSFSFGPNQIFKHQNSIILLMVAFDILSSFF